jgi:serine protease inhibitor
MMQDIAIDSSGKLNLDHNLDIERSYGLEYLTQQIMIRLKTPYNTSAWMPEVGSLLYTLIGKPNIRKVGEEAENFAIDAITRDSFLGTEQIKVVSVPLTETTLALYIYIYPEQDNVTEFIYTIDLVNGSIEST